MTYDLYIGDRLFSSWSMRGWLMLEKFDLPHRVHMVGLYSGTFAEDLAPLAPACRVPVLRTPEGQVVAESLAIAETLAERHPDRAMWPADAQARALARSISAEMVAGFHALRSDCPMQLRHVNQGFDPSKAVLADIARIELLWRSAWETSGKSSGWLFGAYSLADVFYAPVAARIVGYDLPVSRQAKDYCERTLADPAIQAWRKAALEKTYDPFPYPIYEPLSDWPQI